MTIGAKTSINKFERRIYSQNGEDGIIKYIFQRIKTQNKFYVEIGAGDGKQCNSRFLKHQGWSGIQIDSRANPGIEQHFIDVENIESILAAYHVPRVFDLLSIDIDGNDYWIWKAIENYQARVVVIEYNAILGPNSRSTIAYNKNHRWDGSHYFGASLGALQQLGTSKGYSLIGTDSTGVNAFFVQKDLAIKHFPGLGLVSMYHLPQYTIYPISKKKFIQV